MMLSVIFFISTNMDDLLVGLNPFIISNVADADKAQYDQQQLANYIAMFMGNAATMLGEVQELRASVPRMCHMTKKLWGNCNKECRQAATQWALMASEVASMKDFLNQALE